MSTNPPAAEVERNSWRGRSTRRGASRSDRAQGGGTRFGAGPRSVPDMVLLTADQASRRTLGTRTSYRRVDTGRAQPRTGSSRLRHVDDVGGGREPRYARPRFGR